MTIPTLASLDMDVRVFCTNHDCRRFVVIPRGPLIEKLGPDFPFIGLRKRLRCSLCNTKGVDVQPDWPDMMGEGKPLFR